MLATFSGQLTGTSSGSHIYVRGGWIASGSTSVAFICVALIVCFARAPRETGWIGWHGGWDIRKTNTNATDVEKPATALYLQEQHMVGGIEDLLAQGQRAEVESSHGSENERRWTKDLEKSGQGGPLSSNDANQA